MAQSKSNKPVPNKMINGVYITAAGEGETHINIYSNSTTVLGRLLSNFSYSVVQTELGEFNSLEGYYHYLKLHRSIAAGTVTVSDVIISGMDELRKLSGKEAQCSGRLLRSLLVKDKVYVIDKPDDEFNRLFEAALLLKINTVPNLKTMMEDNDMPYVHYYRVGKMNLVLHYERFNWLVDRVNNVSEQLFMSEYI